MGEMGGSSDEYNCAGRFRGLPAPRHKAQGKSIIRHQACSVPWRVKSYFLSYLTCYTSLQVVASEWLALCQMLPKPLTGLIDIELRSH